MISEEPGQAVLVCVTGLSFFFSPLQSWIQSQPPPQSPTCPSLSSSTAGTSGRTCACSASPRKSSHTRDIISATQQFGVAPLCLRSVSFTAPAAAASYFMLKVLRHSPLLAYLFYLKPVWKHECLLFCFSALPPSDSSLTALVTVTALSEVTSGAPPPASIGRTCSLCVQAVGPGCCFGRP